MTTALFVRHRRLIIVIQLALLPVVLWAAYQAYVGGVTDTEEWLPRSFEETRQLDWFREHFVADDLLAISWEGCAVDDPRMKALVEALRQPIDVQESSSELLTRRVITTGETLAQLRDEPLSLSRHQALERMSGWLVDADQKQGVALVFLTNAGWDRREFLTDFIRRTVHSLTGLPDDKIHLAGITLDTMAIDQASNRYMNVMLMASYALSFVLMYGLLRSLPLAIL